MNYWILTTEYPPFYGGGISTYCYQTACMFSENGHQVSVFINDKSVKSFVVEQRAEARIIRFNPALTTTDAFLGHITRLSFEFANIVKIFIEKEGKPDLIESQDYLGISYFLFQFKYCLYDWCKNIPISITIHSPSFLYMEFNQIPIYRQPNFWIGEMERFCIQAADLLISPSEYLVTELKKRFTIHNTNLHILVNPYKIKQVENNSTGRDNSILNNNLTYYGKLSPQKGTFKILELFQVLWENGFDKPFTMVGGQEIVFPPLGKTMGTIIKKRYSKYIKNGLLKLEKKINPSHIQESLSQSIIIIIPSTIDNLPYAVLEMMAQGKIVIASKQGGQSEIISDAEDGFIFDYDVPGSFELTLNKVIHLSKEERLTLSIKAIKKIADKFSFEKVYPQKIKRVENLISGFTGVPKKFPFIRELLPNTEKHIASPSQSGLLSVVIPYYNLGKYIDATVASILNSSYQNLEIIILNDGSTEDLSREKIKKYRNHAKIKVIDKVNSGLADTRNAGAQLAKGEFLAFLDADDTVAAMYYEKAIKIIVHYHNVYFVGAWTQYVEGSKKIWPTFNPEPPILLTHNTINSSSLVYRRSAFLEAGSNDKSFKIGLEDYDSVLSMLSNGLNGVAIPETLFNYRVRKKSMIKGVTEIIRADYFSKIRQKHKKLYFAFEEEVSNLIKFNKPPLSSDNSTLDDLPFQNIPAARLLYRTVLHFTKSNPKLKNSVLFIKNIVDKLSQ